MGPWFTVRLSVATCHIHMLHDQLQDPSRHLVTFALQIVGTSEQVIVALKMISDKVRSVLGNAPGADRDRGRPGDRDWDRGGDVKRIRGPDGMLLWARVHVVAWSSIMQMTGVAGQSVTKEVVLWVACHGR